MAPLVASIDRPDGSPDAVQPAIDAVVDVSWLTSVSGVIGDPVWAVGTDRGGDRHVVRHGPVEGAVELKPALSVAVMVTG